MLDSFVDEIIDIVLENPIGDARIIIRDRLIKDAKRVTELVPAEARDLYRHWELGTEKQAIKTARKLRIAEIDRLQKEVKQVRRSL